MTTAIRRLVPLTLLLLALLPAVAGAEGGSPAPTTGVPSMVQQQSPEQDAIQHYNRGVALRDKAWSLEKKAAEGPAADRAKLEEKAGKLFTKAAHEYSTATARNPRLHQAWSDLGYTLRRTGDYDGALRAYNHALAIAPNYLEAVEYRGEAYLGLNRVDDAKQAYLALFAADRAKADKLLAAMNGWVEKRRAEPAGVDAAKVDAVATWVGQRSELATETGARWGASKGAGSVALPRRRTGWRRSSPALFWPAPPPVQDSLRPAPPPPPPPIACPPGRRPPPPSAPTRAAAVDGPATPPLPVTAELVASPSASRLRPSPPTTRSPPPRSSSAVASSTTGACRSTATTPAPAATARNWPSPTACRGRWGRPASSIPAAPRASPTWPTRRRWDGPTPG